MTKKRVPRARGGPKPKPKPARTRSKAPRDRQPERLTKAAYARHRGISKAAVTKAVREGRILVGPGGRIDRDAADLAWGRNTTARPSPAPSRQLPAPAGPPVDLTEARTMHEYAKAQLAELELGERSGQLVARADMRDAAFRATRAARDLLLSIPDRLAEVLIGVTEPNDMRRLIREEVARACDELASLEPEPDEPAGDAEASA